MKTWVGQEKCLKNKGRLRIKNEVTSFFKAIWVDNGWKVSFEGKDIMIMAKGGSVLKFKRGSDNIYYLTAKRMPSGQIQVLESTQKIKMDINEAHDR